MTKSTWKTSNCHNIVVDSKTLKICLKRDSERVKYMLDFFAQLYETNAKE